MSRRQDRADAVFYFRLARHVSTTATGFTLATVLSSLWDLRPWWAPPSSSLAAGTTTMTLCLVAAGVVLWRRSS